MRSAVLGLVLTVSRRSPAMALVGGQRFPVGPRGPRRDQGQTPRGPCSAGGNSRGQQETNPSREGVSPPWVLAQEKALRPGKAAPGRSRQPEPPRVLLARPPFQLCFLLAQKLHLPSLGNSQFANGGGGVGSNSALRGFPDGPVVKTPHSQYRGRGRTLVRELKGYTQQNETVPSERVWVWVPMAPHHGWFGSSINGNCKGTAGQLVLLGEPRGRGERRAGLGAAGWGSGHKRGPTDSAHLCCL